MPMRSIRHFLCSLFALLLSPFSSFAGTNEIVPIHLEPVFRLPSENAKHPLTTRLQYGFDESKTAGIAFHAVVTNTWFPGLVPLFGIQRAGTWQLRRRPPSGQENITEPLFFALPCEDEPEAHRISGKWSLEALRSTDSKAILGWEFAVDRDQLEGRFDQEGEYRYGFITGGNFLSNRVEVRVEYLNDQYLLTGILKEGRLSGDYKHLNGDETGTWQAWRELPTVRPSKLAEIVSLFEWTRSSDNARAYYLEGIKPEGEWQRSPRPLARVWKIQQ